MQDAPMEHSALLSTLIKLDLCFVYFGVAVKTGSTVNQK